MLVEFSWKAPEHTLQAFVDPQARIAGDVVASEEAVVFYGSVLRGDEGRVFLWKRAVVLENCVAEAPKEFPVVVSNYAMISHGTIVHGAVVEEAAVEGIGAIVLDGARIGRGAVVAAGSVVPQVLQLSP